MWKWAYKFKQSLKSACRPASAPCYVSSSAPEILTESLTLNQSPAEAQSLWHSPGCQGTHLTVCLCIGCAFLTECRQLATSEFHPWLPTPETSPACFMERASRCGSSSAAPAYAVIFLPFVCRLFKFKGTDGSKFLLGLFPNYVAQYLYLSTFFLKAWVHVCQFARQLGNDLSINRGNVAACSEAINVF